jgi:uncharacterized repeat protein (TIGR02543 family)
MKAKKIFLPFAILIIAFFYSCAKDDFVEIDAVCPLVTLTDPIDGAIDIPINKVISAKFNEKMRSTLIEDASFLVAKGDSLISGAVSYADSTAVFTPASPLALNTLYTGTIKTLVKDLRGNALQQDYVWSFRTILPIKKYLVETSSSPTTGGVTSGGGSFDNGTSVTVTATPNTGYNFVNWTAAGTEVSTNSNYTFVLSANTSLVANFSGIYTLNVTAQNGTVLKTPDTATYNGGDTVQLTATPNSGYVFSSWSGDATGSNNPLTVQMNANKNITANFTLIGGAYPSGINLGSAGDFAILGGSGVSNTGTSTQITGDVGSFPTATIDGLLPSNVNGTLYMTADPIVGVAKDDLTTAYNDGQSRSTNAISLPGQLGGLTLAPGLYVNSTTSGISGTGANGILTLDAGGDANAVWIFKMGSTFITDAGTSIVLAGGAKAANIYWSVGTSATLGTNSVFYGNILADQAITLTTGAVLNGRALTRVAAVTLDSNTVTKQ